MAEHLTSSLAGLEYHPYLDEDGTIPELYQGKIGIYAIFDAEKTLQYVGYSRDISLSLKQHLVRVPDKCHYLKFQTIDKPSRTLLETIQADWIAENGSIPPGNDLEKSVWVDPIDAQIKATVEEKRQLEAASGDEMAQRQVLKAIARRVEAETLQQLAQRGWKGELRFNPKMKEQGLLDLK